MPGPHPALGQYLPPYSMLGRGGVQEWYQVKGDTIFGKKNEKINKGNLKYLDKYL